MTLITRALIAASLATTLISALAISDTMAGKGSAARTLGSRGAMIGISQHTHDLPLSPTIGIN